jgi:endonuclease G
VARIRTRLKELQIKFERNPKQDRDPPEIQFFNHLLTASPGQIVPSSAQEHFVTYYLDAQYLLSQLSFRNELITFVSTDLRKDHRKIKISIQAFPTELFQRTRRRQGRPYITKLDLYYEKLTPISSESMAVPAPDSMGDRLGRSAGGRRRKASIQRSRVQMDNVDKKRLRSVIAVMAKSSGNAKEWMSAIVDDSDLPDLFKISIPPLQGAPMNDARNIIDYAYRRGVQPGYPDATALGAILKEVLETDIGLDEAQFVVAIIVKYQLYRNPGLLRQLYQRFGVPEELTREAPVDSLSPWLGPVPPSDDLKLQSFFGPKMDYLDVGFLERAMQSSGSVCRIERPQGRPLGTGFLVGDDLLLTCFHVLQMGDTETLDADLQNVVLRFRNVTARNGQEAEGQVFKVLGTEALLSSPSTQLDFALLQVDPSVKNRTGIKRSTIEQAEPHRGMPLNILQHPLGGPMCLAFSKDGVRDVYPKLGVVQYVTQTSGGSSGSPCFNDDWNVLALHHAERARSFGSIREGMMMSNIYPQIEKYLK